MNLPQELIDEIIRNLASDVQSLRSCSLVAKSWAHPSRKWLFEDVLITRRIYQRWMDRISPGDVKLLRNVRSFMYFLGTSLRDGIAPHRIDLLVRYLPSLSRLERLGLYSPHLGPDVPQQIGLFSAFQQTLSSLSLADCRTTSNALITIINYFPLLVNLDLQALTYEEDRGPVPQLSRPLRGRLVIADCETTIRVLFDKLSNPPPALDELFLHRVYMPVFYDCIVGVHGGSVKNLEMRSGFSEQERTSQILQNFPILMRNINPQ